MHTHLPTDSQKRKDTPICTGVLDYFPKALAAVARLSKLGNDKHNPGQPLHWSRDKSTDHADCILRHMADRGTIDPDTGLLHEVGVAWRALAQLELALEKLEIPAARAPRPDPFFAITSAETYAPLTTTVVGKYEEMDLDLTQIPERF